MSSYSFQGHKRVWTRRDEEENRAIFSTQRQETSFTMPDEFKPVYIANVEYEVEKWPLKKLILLLRLYAAHHCLWDLRNPENRNRKMRKAALIDITAAMGGGVQRAQVVQKINVLRATYRYEKRRIKQRIRKGIGAKTKLKWFALADAFLRQVPRSEKTRKNENADTDSDLEDTVVFTIDPETLVPLDEEDEEETASTQPPKNCHMQNNIKAETFTENFSNLKQSPVSEIGYFDGGHMSDNSPDAATVTVKKEEIACTQIPSANTKKIPAAEQHFKQNWTAKESLQFVRLLRKYPNFWSGNLNLIKNELAELAALMKMPLERIERRVHIFRRTCQSENLKISRNTNYKPNLVWWPIAKSFQSTCCHGQAESTSYFVDANAPQPPATPLIGENKTETDLDAAAANFNSANLELEEAGSPINPLPSVAPPSVLSVAMEDALEALFHSELPQENRREKENLENQTEMKIESRSEGTYTAQTAPRSISIAADLPDEVDDDGSIASSSPVAGACVPHAHTKLIWNGLEDDLLEGKWSLKHSVKFLRLYGAHRCLWDLHDAEYRSREMRSAAIRDIAAAMGYGLNADYVAKKIKIFRITYMQHRKRMLAATQLGKEPELQLRWFPLADSFLRPHIGLRSIKAQDHELPQFDFQYVFANLNLIDPALLTDFRGKGTQNAIEIGSAVGRHDEPSAVAEGVTSVREPQTDAFRQVVYKSVKSFIFIPFTHVLVHVLKGILSLCFSV